MSYYSALVNKMRGLAAFILALPDNRIITEVELATAFIDTGFTVIASRQLSIDQTCATLSLDFGATISRANHVHLIIAFDAWPRTPPVHKQLRYGSLDNERLLKAIQRVGKYFNCSRGWNSAPPCISASLNGTQAANIMKKSGMNITAVLQLARNIDESVNTPAVSVKQIASARLRARLDIVDIDGRRLVRKTFIPSFSEYGARECAVRDKLSPTLSFLDQILDSGTNYFVIPHYHVPCLPGPNSLRLVSVSHARSAIDVMTGFYESGFALLDCNPHSILYAENGEPRVIDLEYVHEYKTRPTSFEVSYDIQGPPKDSELPGAHIAGSFDQRWKPWIGLSFNDLNTQSVPILHVKRIIYVLTRRLPRLVWTIVRDSLRVFRDLIIGCARQYLFRRHPNFISR
jgi:hypothetical protein